MLNEGEASRYERQLMIRGFGESGQERLRKARVVIGGAGSLGTPAALYLAAAGVGTVRIIDHHQVDTSDLNSQVLHWSKDLGRSRLDSLCEKLRQVNDQVEIDAIEENITSENAADLTSGFDVILDGTDDLATRFCLNCAALTHHIPFVHGAVFGFEGRVTTIIPGRTPCLGCLYRGMDQPQKAPSIGVSSAVIGGLQATEAIKCILGIGHVLANQLLVYNGFKMRFSTLAIKRDPTCRHCGPSASGSYERQDTHPDLLSFRI